MNFKLTVPLLSTSLMLANVNSDELQAKNTKSEPKRPNIIFISIDDMNDWAGFLEHSHPDTQTPNIDKLASMGVAFQNAYCNAIMSNPSRSSLLTGVLPSRSGVYNNRSFYKNSPELADVVTMPELLKKNGYYTVNIGKLFHPGNKAWNKEESDANSQVDNIWSQYLDRSGLKEFQKDYIAKNPDKRTGMLNVGKKHAEEVGYYNSGIPYSEEHIQAIEGGSTLDWGGHPCESEFFYSTILPRQTVECLDDVKNKRGEYGDKPFFISCGLGKPHLSWYVPEDYFAKFPIDEVAYIDEATEEADCVDLPPMARAVTEIDKSFKNSKYHLLKKYNKNQEATAAYLACINYVDYSVGLILDAYEALDKETRDNTIIFLWSDHGFHIGEKARYGKGSLWEETCRIPFIIVAPGLTAANANCYSTVSFVDIYPTIVELTGIDFPEHQLDGFSLVPVLKNPQMKWNHPAITTLNQGSHTVRTSEWRYTQYTNGDQELYDHRDERDQAERVNLSNDPRYSKEITKLKSLLPQDARADIAR